LQLGARPASGRHSSTSGHSKGVRGMQPGPANKRLLELMRDVEMAGNMAGQALGPTLPSSEISPAWLHSQMRAQAEQIRTLVEQVQQLSTALSVTIQQLHTSEQRIAQLERVDMPVGGLPLHQGFSPPPPQPHWHPGVQPPRQPLPSPPSPRYQIPGQTSPPMPPQPMLSPGIGFAAPGHPPVKQRQANMPAPRQNYVPSFTPRIEDHPAKLSRVGEEKQRGLSPTWIARQRRELANARLANAQSPAMAGPPAASPASAPTAAGGQPSPLSPAAPVAAVGAAEGLPAFNHHPPAPSGLIHVTSTTPASRSSNLELLAKLSMSSPSLNERARAPGQAAATTTATSAAPCAAPSAARSSSTSTVSPPHPEHRSPNDTVMAEAAMVDEPTHGETPTILEASEVVLDQRSVDTPSEPESVQGAYGWGPTARCA